MTAPTTPPAPSTATSAATAVKTVAPALTGVGGGVAAAVYGLVSKDATALIAGASVFGTSVLGWLGAHVRVLEAAVEHEIQTGAQEVEKVTAKVAPAAVPAVDKVAESAVADLDKRLTAAEGSVQDLLAKGQTAVGSLTPAQMLELASKAADLVNSSK